MFSCPQQVWYNHVNLRIKLKTKYISQVLYMQWLYWPKLWLCLKRQNSQLKDQSDRFLLGDPYTGNAKYKIPVSERKIHPTGEILLVRKLDLPGGRRSQASQLSQMQSFWEKIERQGCPPKIWVPARWTILNYSHSYKHEWHYSICRR